MADSADLALETPVDYEIEIDRLCNLSEKPQILELIRWGATRVYVSE